MKIGALDQTPQIFKVFDQNFTFLMTRRVRFLRFSSQLMV